MHPALKHWDVREGCLQIGGLSLTRLADRVGQTPFFAYDRRLIDARVELLRAHLPEHVHLHYAVKANPMPAVVHHLRSQVDGFDVASSREMLLALDTGMSAEHIAFAGPGKTDAELSQAVAAGVLIEVESEGELARLRAIAEHKGYAARIAIRVNPDFELKGSGMRMGGGSQQFGIDAEHIPDVLATIGASGLRFEGFHIFAGSQNLRAEIIIEAQMKSAELALRLSDGLSTPLRYLNIGGGFGIPYFPKDQPLDLVDIGRRLGTVVREVAKRQPLAQVVIELGRYIIGEAGIYVSRIIDRKKSRGQVFLVTDGGLHHQLAASGNFGQVIRRNYPVAIGNRFADESREIVSVVGCLCTPLDLLGDRCELPIGKAGDLFVVFQSGAYGLSASPTAFWAILLPSKFWFRADRERDLRMAGGQMEIPAARAAVASMARTFRGRRLSEVTVARGNAAIWATDKNSGVVCAPAEPWTAIIGSPRWRDKELSDEARARGNAAALRLAFRQWGDALFEKVGGEFAFAVLDPQGGSAMLATDRMGIHPLYYGETDGTLVFGSTADLVRGYPGFGATIPAQAIYNYLQAYVCRSPGTIYAEQRKLGPAECLYWRQGDVRVKPYWRTSFLPDDHQPPRELAAKLVAEVRKAVKRSVPAARVEGIGAFLSGGLDSSTVCGMLSELTGDPVNTFTIGFDDTSYDEMYYADATSRRFGTRSHRYYLTPDDVVLSAPKIAAFFDEPFGNSSAVPVYHCAVQARETNMTCLLAGDGGDEILAGNSRYLEQQRYERYQRMPALLRGGLSGLANHIPLLRGSRLWGKARRFIARAETPLPERLEAFSFFQMERMSEVFDPDVLSSLDLEAPWRAMREAYLSTPSDDTLHRMMHLDLRQTLADNDLKKVTAMCDLAGIDVRFPLLDDELVAFCATIPPRLHLQNGRLRAFFKDAFRDFLPAAVIKKKKHGFGMPFYEWTRDHPSLRTLAYDSLLSLRKRNLLRETFIDTVMQNHARPEATPYDGLVWDLMMLELWLQSHPPVDL